MPARYPPIAPRAGPTTPRLEPTAPSGDGNNNLAVLPSDDGYAAQLDALARDKRRFLDAHHPIKDALHMALQQPAGILLARYADTQRRYQAAAIAPAPSDEPGERSVGTAIEADDRPAIVAFTETMVAKAILGDSASQAMVADRVEGKTGLRRADVDAETMEQRARMRATITQLVSDMVDRRATRADRAEPVDVLEVDDTSQT